MGIIGIIGDYTYLQGIKERNFLKFQIAQYLFPFDRELLIAPAQYYFKEQKIDKDTLVHLKKALKHDPYSIQFLGLAIQIEYIYGNKNEAKLMKQKLEKLGPNSNILKRINDMMKGFK